jgi:thiamine-phosphate pyrophosphorylase
VPRPDALPPLHAVTDDRVVASDGFVAAAEEVLRAGGARVALHLRAPAASGRTLHDLAARLVEVASACGARLLVNDRVDVAMAVGAHGVQLGRRSPSVADARRVLQVGNGADERRLVGGLTAEAAATTAHSPPARTSVEWLVGASVHDLVEAREAVDAGADFLVAGAVYATASHPERPAAEVRLIEEVAALGLPVIAIGGVTVERAGELRRAGAAGVAVIRGIWDSPSPGEAVQRYLEAWQS